MSPPVILAAEEAGSSEVVTAGIAGRILNPRSRDLKLKDRCDYSSSLSVKAHIGRAVETLTLTRPLSFCEMWVRSSQLFCEKPPFTSQKKWPSFPFHEAWPITYFVNLHPV